MSGTISREGIFVRGECQLEPDGHAVDVLVYEIEATRKLVCADHMRIWMRANPRVEVCDECGATPAWRDPVTRKNEFFCAKCHGDRGTVFQNRWAPTVREGATLGVRERPVCELKSYGTECKGEVKWRSAMNLSACNKHAGKTSAGPEWHQ